MAHVTETQINAAIERGKQAAATEACAVSATYDRTTGKITIELANGVSTSIPVRLIQGLAGATEMDLAAVTVSPGGFGLHWEALDVDLTVPGLLAGVCGTKTYMAKQLAAQAGKAVSKAKSDAARENGKKGGRPSKREGSPTAMKVSMRRARD